MINRFGDPFLEDDNEDMEDKTPYTSIANDDSGASSREAVMNALRAKQAGDFQANMGRAFSNFSRGMNAPESSDGFYDALEKQGAANAKMLSDAELQSQKVKEAILNRQAKADALKASENRFAQAEENRDRRQAEALASAERRAQMTAERISGMNEFKQGEKLAQLEVPGYEMTGTVKPTVDEAKDLRKAKATAQQLSGKLQELRDLVDKYGSFEYGGEGGAKMSSLATEIQLLAKSPEIYQLGVLTGPDMTLLEKITASPDSLDSLFTRDSTRKAQLGAQAKSVQDKLNSVAESRGYKQTGADKETKVVNGVTYVKVPGGWKRQ